jgi:6-phosphogluconolactonase (cycloisomerase 2 family)
MLIVALMILGSLGQPVAADGHRAPQPRISSRRSLYVGHRDSKFLSVFAIDPDGGLSSATHVPSGAGPIGIAFAPDASIAYVVNAFSNSISRYGVGEDGGLTELRPRVRIGVAGPSGSAVTPDGLHFYVADQDSSTVAAFTIGAAGELFDVGEFPSGSALPREVAVTPNGRFLVVSHWSPDAGGPSTLSTFAIWHDGRLRPRGTVTIGLDGAGMAISPDGAFLYVNAQTSGEVFGFRIGWNGHLRRVPGSPFPAGRQTQGIAMSPDGRRLFVSNVISKGVVWAFAVGARGRLTPVIRSPFRAGDSPTGLVVTPDGRHLYASNFGSDDVSAFAITRKGGLTRIGSFPTGGIGPAAFQGTEVLPDQGPTARFSSDAGRVGRVTRFDASASFDPDGQVVEYRWSFGDGTVLRDGGSEPSHVYRRPGAFRVTLLVTDDEGCSRHLVFTGQSALCNGSHVAMERRTIVVAPDDVVTGS